MFTRRLRVVVWTTADSHAASRNLVPNQTRSLWHPVAGTDIQIDPCHLHQAYNSNYLYLLVYFIKRVFEVHK
jgi:hypothetical protein